MKTRFVVLLNTEPARKQAGIEFLKRIGRPDLIDRFKRGMVRLTLPTEADLVAVQAEALELGFENLYVKKEHSYARRELSVAPLLNLRVTTAEKGYGGFYYGTQFELSQACPTCGSGARQTSPLVLKESDTPSSGDIFQTMDYDYLVSPRLAETIAHDGVTGVELRQAVGTGDGRLPWHQIISRFELPPMSDLTRGILVREPCVSCGRDGRFGSPRLPLEIAYDSKSIAVDLLPDMVYTYERFGKGRLDHPLNKSRLAYPALIVSPKVYKLFAKERVRGVEFVPVQIVDL